MPIFTDCETISVSVQRQIRNTCSYAYTDSENCQPLGRAVQHSPFAIDACQFIDVNMLTISSSVKSAFSMLEVLHNPADQNGYFCT